MWDSDRELKNKWHHEKNRLAEEFGWMTPQYISLNLSAAGIADIFKDMLEEIDGLLKTRDEYHKLQDDMMKNASQSSLNILKAVLAGTQVNLPKDKQDPSIISFIEGSDKSGG